MLACYSCTVVELYKVRITIILQDSRFSLCSDVLHAISGVVTISPPRIASVCSGDQLELMCNVTGMFLEWNISRIDVETGVARQFVRRSITADGPADIQTFPVEYNSTIFMFSRTSSQGSPVLTSRVMIDSVKDSLNGTVVTCVDLTSPNMESSTTIIMTINSRIQSMWIVTPIIIY